MIHMIKNLKFLQKALIEKEGKILFIKRSEHDEDSPGKWDIPGGNVDEDEDVNEAILREISEETNLLVNSIRPLCLTSFNNWGYYVIAAIYTATYSGNEVVLSEEHQDFK